MAAVDSLLSFMSGPSLSSQWVEVFALVQLPWRESAGETLGVSGSESDDGTRDEAPPGCDRSCRHDAVRCGGALSRVVPSADVSTCATSAALLPLRAVVVVAVVVVLLCKTPLCHSPAPPHGTRVEARDAAKLPRRVREELRGSVLAGRRRVDHVQSSRTIVTPPSPQLWLLLLMLEQLPGDRRRGVHWRRGCGCGCKVLSASLSGAAVDITTRALPSYSASCIASCMWLAAPPIEVAVVGVLRLL